jgi:hypothetical protein
LTGSTAHGHCDDERKVVQIGLTSDDDDALDALLIHEISHAVASPCHGETWQRRLALAADVARKIGRHRLAELLEAEIVNYREKAEPLAVAYDEVRDALLLNPDLTLAQIKRWLTQMYGVPFGKVERTYRALRTVYGKAREEALELREARRAWDNGRAEVDVPPTGGA